MWNENWTPLSRTHVLSPIYILIHSFRLLLLQKSQTHRLLPNNLYVILYNFKARHPDELDLKAGYKVSWPSHKHRLDVIFANGTLLISVPFQITAQSFIYTKSIMTMKCAIICRFTSNVWFMQYVNSTELQCDAPSIACCPWRQLRDRNAFNLTFRPSNDKTAPPKNTSFSHSICTYTGWDIQTKSFCEHT